MTFKKFGKSNYYVYTSSIELFLNELTNENGIDWNKNQQYFLLKDYD